MPSAVDPRASLTLRRPQGSVHSTTQGSQSGVKESRAGLNPGGLWTRDKRHLQVDLAGNSESSLHAAQKVLGTAALQMPSVMTLIIHPYTDFPAPLTPLVLHSQSLGLFPK